MLCKYAFILRAINFNYLIASNLLDKSYGMYTWDYITKYEISFWLVIIYWGYPISRSCNLKPKSACTYLMGKKRERGGGKQNKHSRRVMKCLASQSEPSSLRLDKGKVPFFIFVSFMSKFALIRHLHLFAVWGGGRIQFRALSTDHLIKVKFSKGHSCEARLQLARIMDMWLPVFIAVGGRYTSILYFIIPTQLPCFSTDLPSNFFFLN